MQERSNRLPSHIHPISTPPPTPNIYGRRLVLNVYWKMDRKDFFPLLCISMGIFHASVSFLSFSFWGWEGVGGCRDEDAHFKPQIINIEIYKTAERRLDIRSFHPSQSKHSTSQ